MKTIITLLLSAYLLPVALSAQPTVYKNEFYPEGYTIEMVNCDATGITAGTAGVNVTWDFSGLAPSGGFSTTTVLNDTSTVFTTSDLMEIRPDGTIAFIQENSTNTYINGVYNPGTTVTTNYNNYYVSVRPFTYNTSYLDSYNVAAPATNVSGTGYLTALGDAYGTLILPSGSYPNVLRIKEEQREYDTAGSSPSYTLTMSYLWFDTGHRAPLLRMDSVISTGTVNSQKVMYLSPTSGVKNLNSYQASYSGFFDNAGHLVVEGFETEKNYTVVVYNIIGNKVFSQDFSATDPAQQFDVTALKPGIYLVYVTAKTGAVTNPQVFKVVKTD